MEHIVTAIQISAGIATMIAVSVLAYQTWQLRNERVQVFRAWVGEAEAHIPIIAYSNAKDEVKSLGLWDKMSKTEKLKFNWTEVERCVILKNFGKLPAINLQSRIQFLVDKEPIKKDFESLSFSSSAIMMPGGEQKLFFEMSKEEEIIFRDQTKQCFLIWEIKYYSQKSDEERRLGIISEFRGATGRALGHWDETTLESDSPWNQSFSRNENTSLD